MVIDGFLFKTRPYAHQLDALKASRDEQVYPFFHEQGTGKSFVVVVETADLWARGHINAVVIVAPNGVHRQWITKQYAEHCPVPWRGAFWRATMRKEERTAWENAWVPADELRVFSFNVEAFSTAGGKGAKELRRILNAFGVYMAVDESTRIKTPGRKRTRTINNLGKYAAFRRILTGTPITNRPLDLYAQCRFLDWTILGWNTFTGFKHHYAEWERRRTSNNRQGWYEELVRYRNQDELIERLRRFPHCRKRKADCLDLPPKVYETRPVELSTEQNALYRQLADDENFPKPDLNALDEPTVAIEFEFGPAVTLAQRLQIGHDFVFVRIVGQVYRRDDREERLALIRRRIPIAAEAFDVDVMTGERGGDGRNNADRVVRGHEQVVRQFVRGDLKGPL